MSSTRSVKRSAVFITHSFLHSDSSAWTTISPNELQALAATTVQVMSRSSVQSTIHHLLYGWELSFLSKVNRQDSHQLGSSSSWWDQQGFLYRWLYCERTVSTVYAPWDSSRELPWNPPNNELCLSSQILREQRLRDLSTLLESRRQVTQVLELNDHQEALLWFFK